MALEMKPYQLVEFTNEEQVDGKKVIDCVPSKWITYDPKQKSLVTKFMPPPYMPSKLKILKFLIESNAQAPSWPYYSIKIHGDAR